jgi:hypothetical protein
MLLPLSPARFTLYPAERKSSKKNILKNRKMPV